SVDRAWYGYPLLHSAWAARKLGHKRISAIEFGVAGGNGLVSLERHAERVHQETGVEVAVYGFDTGEGMPQPQDMRDMPYLWQSGYFAMDQAKLKARLRVAKLVLGQVEDTVAQFFAKENPPPIGFISFDLDYYSSTVAALKILDAEHARYLPRVVCYFDDLAGGISDAYNEFAGELLAIKEFNDAHADIKISRVRGLSYHSKNIPAQWHEKIYVTHRFAHPDYGKPTSDTSELALHD
ncbi:MAG TPA: hypothetical protein VGC27_08005, partial [Rhizomicrobium sp.]